MGRLYRHTTVPDLLFYHIGTQSLTPEKHQITPRISGPSKILCRHSDGKYRGKAERRVSLCCLCFSFRSQRLAQPVTAALTDRTDGGGHHCGDYRQDECHWDTRSTIWVQTFNITITRLWAFHTTTNDWIGATSGHVRFFHSSRKSVIRVSHFEWDFFFFWVKSWCVTSDYLAVPIFLSWKWIISFTSLHLIKNYNLLAWEPILLSYFNKPQRTG